MKAQKGKKKEQIEKQAYARYLERGCEQGKDREDWDAAEREVANVWRRDSAIISILIVVFLAALFLTSKTLFPLVMFWGLLAWVLFVTAYTSLMPLVHEPLFRGLRAFFMSMVAVVPALTFVFQYWPMPIIETVENVETAAKEKSTAPNSYVIPKIAGFQIDNKSDGGIDRAQVRYALIMQAQDESGGVNAPKPCALSYSTSSENFSIGPKSARGFEFDFGMAKGRTARDVPLHHVHLIAYLKYWPLLLPLPAQERQEVFYYAPVEGRWTLQRQDSPKWRASIERWRKALVNAEAGSPLEGIPLCEDVQMPAQKIVESVPSNSRPTERPRPTAATGETISPRGNS